MSQVQSTNWSGYADTGSGFSTVTGSWTEPSVSCTSQTSLAAFWAGIDGYSSTSVEQDGTLAECYGGALPGDLNGSGNSFAVTWERSS